MIAKILAAHEETMFFARLPFRRSLWAAAPFAASAILPIAKVQAGMVGSDSDEAYGDEGFGKECSISGWWHLGCNNVCFGREEKITCAAGAGSVMPDATFNCPGCGLVFHGDCCQFTKGEKLRLRAARSAGKNIAACGDMVI